MKLSEIIAAVPGVRKDLVHYLERINRITPARSKTRGGEGSYERREYSEADLNVIREEWIRRVTKRQNIHGKDRPQRKVIAFILVKAQAHTTNSIVQVMKQFPEALEIGVVFGTWDIIAKVLVNDLSDLYELVSQRLKQLHKAKRTRTQSLIVASSNNPRDKTLYWDRPDRVHPNEPQRLRAYILLQTAHTWDIKVSNRLKTSDCVIGFARVFGSADIVLTVTVNNLKKLSDFVTEQVSRKEYFIEDSATFLVHEGQYWRNPAYRDIR